MTIKDEIKKSFICMVSENEEKMTISSLCQRLNISRKTFYKYYNDKYDLIHQIIYDDIFEYLTYLSKIEGVKADDSIFVLTSMYTRIYENREFYKKLNLMETNLFLDIFYEETYKLNKSLFTKEGKEEAEWEYQCFLAANSGKHIIEKWMNDNFVLPPRKVAELFYKYVTRAWIEDINKYQ